MVVNILQKYCRKKYLITILFGIIMRNYWKLSSVLPIFKSRLHENDHI